MFFYSNYKKINRFVTWAATENTMDFLKSLPAAMLVFCAGVKNGNERTGAVATKTFSKRHGVLKLSKQ
jgi:hypothetical protein